MKVSVTFEFETRPPVTHKMPNIEGGQPWTVARRAVVEAQKVLRPINWISAVVLLDRWEDVVPAEPVVSTERAPSLKERVGGGFLSRQKREQASRDANVSETGLSRAMTRRSRRTPLEPARSREPDDAA
jgi:hypothetical protein